MRKSIGLIIPSFILLIFACQPPGGPEDLPPLDEVPVEENNGEKSINSITPGKFVSQEESIPIEIDVESLEREPSELIVDLLEMDGTVVASQQHVFGGSGGIESLPALKLPQIPEGQYILRYKIYDIDGEFFYEENVSFFYITKTYEITGIRSYPNAIQPRSTAILKAGILAPEESDPYVHWKVGDSIISQGYLSGGANTVSWSAPEVEGIYSVSLEVFPVKPAQNMTFSSEIQMATEIYVSTDPSPEQNELQQEENYYSLYHFRGNTADSGYRLKPEKVTFIGAPELRLEGDIYGYYLDGQSGFTMPDLFLPTEGQDLLPFSLVIQGVFRPLRPNQTLCAVVNNDDSFSFMIKTDNTGRLQAVVRNRTRTAVSTVPDDVSTLFLEVTEKPDTVLISVVPYFEERTGKRSLDVLWYIQDMFLHRESIQIDTTIETAEGSTILGGVNGFIGLVDEFGLYHPRNGDSNRVIEGMYHQVLEEEYGIDLRFAEGFDGIGLPPECKYSGEVTLQQGRAVMQPDSGIELPSLLVRNETLDINVETYGPIPSREDFFCAIAFPETEIPDIRINADRTVFIQNDKVTLSTETLEKNSLQFALSHGDDGVFLIRGEERIKLFEDPVGSVNVYLSLQNETEQEVFIEGISIISSSQEIVKKDQGKQTSEDSGTGSPETPPINSDSLVAVNTEANATNVKEKESDKNDEIL